MNSLPISRRANASLIRRVLALFGIGRAPEPAMLRLAEVFAATLREQTRLAERVVSLAGASRRERVATLIRAAQAFRTDWATYSFAEILMRLADNPTLFHAVVEELRSAPAEIVQLPTACRRAPLAQAA